MFCGRARSAREQVWGALSPGWELQEPARERGSKYETAMPFGEPGDGREASLEVVLHKENVML